MLLVDLDRGWLRSCGLEIPLRGYSHGGPLFLPPLEIARNRPIPELLDKRLVFVTGKGGVGKTTVAVALGLRAAAEGKRTIVCEVASQENASRIFDHTEVGFHEVEMEENLWSISIDPDESMREYVLLQLKVRAMRDMLFRSRIFNYLAAATPGLKELVTIGKIWELAQLDRKVKKGRKYDLVIVDAPATGHGIGFLQTPRTFAAIARVGPIHSQAQPLDRFITDHEHTGTAIVALPEEMPVNESAALEHDLRDEVGVAVDRVYMNGLYPERFSKAEAERLAALAEGEDGAARAAARAALSEHAAPAPSAPSWPGCGAGSRRRSRPSPSSSSPSWAARRRAASPGGSPDADARRHPRGQGDLHLRRLRRSRQDDDLGGDRHRDGGPGPEGLRADDRPGEAPRRLARPEGAGQRGAPGRPGAVREQGIEMKGELWAMMLDAKATFDELVARQAPDEESRDRVLEQPHLPADLQRPGRLAGVHGDGEALRAAHRGRFDLLVLDTPPTRNALDFLDAPRRLTQFIEGRSLRVFMKPTGLAAKVAGRGASVALSVFKRIVGFDLLADLAEFFNAFSGMVEGFQARAKRVNSCSPTPAPASSSSAAPRASRSTRPSTSTASWWRRSCPSAA